MIVHSEVEPFEQRTYDKLTVKIFGDKHVAGKAAAVAAEEIVKTVLDSAERTNLLFSTGASQFELVDALVETGIPWNRVVAFHLDEYQHIGADHPASFRLWLRTRIEERVHPNAFHYIHGDADDTDAECARYAALLSENPIDLGFIGVGENGHIAFNDPPVADFNDAMKVRVVELDEMCRRQQFGEGWFDTLSQVPRKALTVTVPSIMACQAILSVVPDLRKAEAVKQALEGPITSACPASILRTHPKATLFLDKASASKLA